ncbi:MAG: chromosome partitioning protein [Treponema sp.]|jgi:phage shock protein A|nr:chromosome partitioning protein [Treponema sp.]
MEQGIDDLRGMSPADAKEYIFHFITALKLAEKDRAGLEAELEKWRKREELARSRGAEDLAGEARQETERIRAKVDLLSAEEAGLKAQIETMRKQLPGLAARERSVDPDLLEQELNIALGKDLAGSGSGGPSGPGLDRQFEGMNADAALEALKARMGLGGAAEGGGDGMSAEGGEDREDGMAVQPDQAGNKVP